jgi:transmembrane sensor
MTASNERVRELIGQEAAEWFVINRGAVTAKERHDFADWVRTSPVHVEEYLAISLVGRDLHAACANADETVIATLLARAQAEELTPRVSRRERLPRPGSGFNLRWPTAALAGAALAVLSFAVIGLWAYRPFVRPVSSEPDVVTTLHFATRHGEHLSERLADNSLLHLNTDSAVTVRYSRHQRNVTLEGGEVEFEVAHLPQRPFRVSAGTAQIVDLGTTFNVRLVADATVVTVVEGLVAVAPLLGKGEVKALQLGADQQVSVRADAWPASVVPVDAQRSTGWLHRQITFEHEPLANVVSEFNRYSTKRIEITTPALRTLEISGIFSIDDPDAFIAFLRSLDGVQVEVTDKLIRVSQH